LKTNFDYIIVGAGAAGLSLVNYLLDYPELADKEILLIDKDSKTSNDRTWCFWQKTDSPFDQVLHAQWQHLYFHSNEFSKLLDIHPYRYKMLRSSDFYKVIWEKVNAHRNITVIQDEVLELEPEGKVVCAKGAYKANFVFNSAIREIPQEKDKHYLLQHFKGWFVETTEAAFDVEKPVLMDFRVEQFGDCRFVYVLPTSPNKALVEYTLFSKNILGQEVYDRELKTYLKDFLGIESYTITETEFGVIPMTNAKIPMRKSRHVINVGTAGGHTKASTGYTFTFIQRRCQKIAANLAKGKDPLLGLESTWDKYYLYDSIFLRVLSESNYPSWRVFHDLFSQLPPTLVLDFLDENSNLLADIRLMHASHIPTFLKASFKELL
jgi:lycopene beta-cyclase